MAQEAQDGDARHAEEIMYNNRQQSLNSQSVWKRKRPCTCQEAPLFIRVWDTIARGLIAFCWTLLRTGAVVPFSYKTNKKQKNGVRKGPGSPTAI